MDGLEMCARDLCNVLQESQKVQEENERLKKYKRRCARLLNIIDYLNLKKRGVELVSGRGYVELACPFRTKSVLEREIALNKEKATEYYYNYLQEQKKSQKLKKKLEIATKALMYYAQCKHINLDLVTIRDDCAEFEAFEDGEHARKALKEIEELDQ